VLVAGLKLPPVAVQFTPAPSFVVAVTDSFCVTVSPARFGETETVNEPVPLMVILRSAVLLCEGLAESVTLIVKLDVPVAVGVPLITPVEALSASPAGSEPTEIDHV
jgi:hypothetical protein